MVVPPQLPRRHSADEATLRPPPVMRSGVSRPACHRDPLEVSGIDDALPAAYAQQMTGNLFAGVEHSQLSTLGPKVDLLANIAEILSIVVSRQTSLGKGDMNRTETFRRDPAGNQSCLAKTGHQPEASLAGYWGDPDREA
jgi:hypothetical protein